MRLECSGVCFLRSICRLTHRGHAQYVKGDGDVFGDFLELHYPGLNNNCLSRADCSNRQDWSLEAAYEIFPLLKPLLDYEVKSLLDDPNVLRDSILIQLETLHFEAYCHVCALLWRVIFMELRGLTNSKQQRVRDRSHDPESAVRGPIRCRPIDANTKGPSPLGT